MKKKQTKTKVTVLWYNHSILHQMIGLRNMLIALFRAFSLQTIILIIPFVDHSRREGLLQQNNNNHHNNNNNNNTCNNNTFI